MTKKGEFALFEYESRVGELQTVQYSYIRLVTWCGGGAG